MANKVNKPSLREEKENNTKYLNSKIEHPVWGSPLDPMTKPLPDVVEPKQFAQELLNYVRDASEADLSPFYQYLLEGLVPLEGVQEWVKQLYFDARGFPVMIAQIIANCPYQFDVRQIFGLNLAEELGEFHPEKEHPILLMKTGKALGLTEEEIEFAKPFPEVLIYLEYRHMLVRNSDFLQAIIAGSLSNEATIVRRYKKIIAALKKHYNVKDDDLEYFYIHSGGMGAIDYGGDVAHANEALYFIEKYATTAETQEKCRQTIWRAVESRKMYQWGLFRHIILKDNPDYLKLLSPKQRAA